MDNNPYTTRDEDPFSAGPVRAHPRRKRSSMLDKWIQDQQLVSASPKPPSGSFQGAATCSNPWLAYPESPRLDFVDETGTLDSYDLLSDPDIPQVPQEVIRPDTRTSFTSTSRSPRTTKFMPSTTSLRNIGLTLRSTSSSTTPSFSAASASPSSKRSIFSFGSRPGSTNSKHAAKHSRSSSLSTLSILQSQPSPLRPSPTPSTKWRPSVLNHFSSSQSTVQDSDTPPRPSMSSSRTGTTATSTTYFDPASSPSQLSLVSSARHRDRSYGAASALSFLSHPQESTDLYRLSSRVPSVMSHREPLGEKPRLRNASADLSKAHSQGLHKSTSKLALHSLAGKSQRKKRLVISGIHPDDIHKLEGAQRWCESFGELRSIKHQRNGDLHISFRDSTVADTVCRLRTQVFIAGVGSVQLSWFVGPSPP